MAEDERTGPGEFYLDKDIDDMWRRARLSELAWVVSQCERDAVEVDCPDFVRRVKARMKQLETGKE